MGQPRQVHQLPRDFGYWKPLIERIARRWRTDDPEEIEAELARHVYAVLNQPPKGIRNWRAFMTTVLNRKASNWIRDRKKEHDYRVSFDESAGGDLEDPVRLEDVLGQADQHPGRRLAIIDFLERLDPTLRPVWIALMKTGGNQSEAAVLLGVHRNTFGKRVRSLTQRLIENGLGRENEHPTQAASKPPGTRSIHTPRRAHTGVSRQWLERLTPLRLGGTAWRVLVWLLRESRRSKRALIPAAWMRIVRALSIRYCAVRRSGIALQKAGLLRIQAAKVGLQTFRHERK